MSGGATPNEKSHAARQTVAHDGSASGTAEESGALKSADQQGSDPGTEDEGARRRGLEQERFASLCEEFLRYLSGVRHLSANTVRSYRSDLEQYVDWIRREGVSPLEVSHRELRRYLAEMSHAGYAPKTINRHLSSLRSLYEWLLGEGVTSKDSAAAISSKKVVRSLPKTLTEEEVHKLLADCDVSTSEGLRDRAFLELLYASGARISEVSQLDVSDVELGRAAQVRLFGKGSKERIVPLYPVCCSWIERYEREARPGLLKRRKAGSAITSSLFVSTRGARMSAAALRSRFELHARNAGLDDEVTPHAMRHTFATELLSGGADLKSVQELLGHASLSTTQIYTHLSVDRLKEATHRAHPRG